MSIDKEDKELKTIKINEVLRELPNLLKTKEVFYQNHLKQKKLK
jgi:hypothetical protein